MTARFRIPLMAVALAWLASLGMSRTAEAALSLTIAVTDATGSTVYDQVVINQASLTVNVSAPVNGTNGGPGSALLKISGGQTSISYDGSLGGVTFNFSTNAVTNEPGTAANAFLNLGSNNNVVNTVTNEARRIVISAVADGYYQPYQADLEHKLTGTVSVLTGGTFTGDPVDPASLKLGTAWGTVEDGSTDDLVSTGQFNVGPGDSLSNSKDAPPGLIQTDLVTPYTMTTVFAGTLAGGTSLSGFSVNHQVMPVAVPEPTNIAMAGVGVLLSLGALRRRGRA